MMMSKVNDILDLIDETLDGYHLPDGYDRLEKFLPGVSEFSDNGVEDIYLCMSCIGFKKVEDSCCRNCENKALHGRDDTWYEAAIPRFSLGFNAGQQLTLEQYDKAREQAFLQAIGLMPND